jgi:hypothetical protein
MIGLLGIAGAIVYGAAWISLAAAQQSRNIDTYLWLGLLTLPLVIMAAIGCAWASAQPRLGGALMIFGGALLILWGAFVSIDVGPGWFFAGLVVLAGGLVILRRCALTVR